MNTNVNLPAAVGILLLLGAGALLMLICAVLLYALLTRRLKLARTAACACALLFCLYFGLMLAFSLASRDEVLARGVEKHFCEIDCHLAYAVVDAQRVKVLGPQNAQASPGHSFNLVTIRTRFDETTISLTRGDGLLYPNSRTVRLVDETGAEYSPSIEGERLLSLSGGVGTPLETPLRPGESYTTTLVFDLPDDVRNPTLSFREGDLVTRFIIGHENSPLHGRTGFQLQAQ